MPPKNLRYQSRGKPEKVEFPLSQYYESIEFNLADGQTNYDLDAQQSTAFSNFKSYTSIIIRSNKDITIRLNATTNHAITVGEAETPFEITEKIEITNLYLTNASGATAAIKILAFNRMKGHD